MRAADVTAAAENMLTRLTESHDPTIRLRRDSSLVSGFERASKRMIGDGAWTWGRRTSSGSIAAVEAASNAVHALMRAREPAAAPVIIGL